MKELTVIITGKKPNRREGIVQLNGVLPNESLTPKLARRAARVAQGTSAGATVWDWEAGVGYRLYKHSARRLYLDEHGGVYAKS